MALVLFQTRRVREALRAPSGFFPDLVFLLFAASIVGMLVMMGRQASIQINPDQKTYIDTSISALPKYTMLSLGRGFAAYFLSLVFTLIYGTVAAHNHRAEKLMLPALDVMQAIPVLSILPPLVMAMIRIFPTREIGLEIACIVMIFTAQVWNMTFSFHGSLRGIPQPLREVAAIQRLSGWKTFRLLEVPAAMIGLVWNSMMSMAGGWFFLTANEAFTLGSQDYRLPGIGSYMQEAIDTHNIPAQLAAIVAMVLMIVAVDQIFWRPIVAWAQRFKMDDIAQADVSKSWMLDLLRKSKLYTRFGKLFAKKRKPEANAAQRIAKPQAASESEPLRKDEPASIKPEAKTGQLFRVLIPMLKWLAVLALLAMALWGMWVLIELLIGLPMWDRAAAEAGKSITEHEDWAAVLLALLASFMRTTAAVVIGAAWALPVGIMIGLSPKWSSRLQPIIQVVASFPAPMLFPLVTMAIVFFHVPFTAGCVALMLLGAQWYILFNVIAGASAIPNDLREVGHVYRMSRWERWRRLYLPCTFPYLITGLVTAAGGAWNATIVSEIVKVGEQTQTAFGLGSMISKASANVNGDSSAKIYASLLAAATVTMAVFVVMVNRFFWKRMYRLAENRYSLNV
jgi:NitT/TauT family transport system permease protein